MGASYRNSVWTVCTVPETAEVSNRFPCTGVIGVRSGSRTDAPSRNTRLLPAMEKRIRLHRQYEDFLRASEEDHEFLTNAIFDPRRPVSCPPGALPSWMRAKTSGGWSRWSGDEDEKGLKLARTVRNQTLARLLIRRANLEKNDLTLTRLRSERPIRQPPRHESTSSLAPMWLTHKR
jgi:hypothetical protein